MLYLTRKRDESIVINDSIVIKVVEIKRNQIKLGFEFPKTMTILRKEVYDKINQENIQAGLTDSGLIEAFNMAKGEDDE